MEEEDVWIYEITGSGILENGYDISIDMVLSSETMMFWVRFSC